MNIEVQRNIKFYKSFFENLSIKMQRSYSLSLNKKLNQSILNIPSSTFSRACGDLIPSCKCLVLKILNAQQALNQFIVKRSLNIPFKDCTYVHFYLVSQSFCCCNRLAFCINTNDRFCIRTTQMHPIFVQVDF